MLGSSSGAAVVEEFKKLVCWDFDGTITALSCHTHNNLVSSGYKEKSSGEVLEYYQANLLKVENIRDLDRLAQAFINIHKQGHHQAITSFNWFPEIMKPTIQFILETYLKKQNDDKDTLAEEQVVLIANILDKLYVVGGFPSNEGIPKIKEGSPVHPNAKQQHIKLAQQHFNILQPEHVCLIDDNQHNCTVAKLNGHRVIYAAYHYSNVGFYLSQISYFFLQAAKKEQETFLQVDEDDDTDVSDSYESEEDEALPFLPLVQINSDQDLFWQFKQLSLSGKPKGLRCSMDDAKSDTLDSLVGRKRLVQSGG